MAETELKPAAGPRPAPVPRRDLRLVVLNWFRELTLVPVIVLLLIISSVAVEPGTLFLSRMTPEEAMKGMKKDAWKVVLKNVHHEPFSVVEVTSLAPYLGATYRPLKEKHSYEVLVEVKPNTILKQGRYFSDLLVKTNLPDAQSLKVPVCVEVR